MKDIRTARIKRNANAYPSGETVAKYLPSGYQVISVTDDQITIEGEDYAGWTLDGYVIPRLSSGGITAREVQNY